LQPIGLTKLPHDLLRRMPLPLQLSHLLAHSGDRDSHNGWTTFRGSRQVTGQRLMTYDRTKFAITAIRCSG
ncbi:MAG TPA: hypothetical protein VIM33_09615, partial [Gaiellaceae bacterium]